MSRSNKEFIAQSPKLWKTLRFIVINDDARNDQIGRASCRERVSPPL